MYEEITVKCSICGDSWDTPLKVGEYEGCSNCGDVFIIHESDVVTPEELHDALDPEEIAFQSAKEESQ